MSNIPTSGPRRTPKTKPTKEKIISAAAKLLETDGFRVTSLDEVARLAGLTKASVYYYFDSKEALYSAVVFPRIREAMDRASASLDTYSDPHEAIESLFRGVLERAPDPHSRYLHYQELLPLNDDARRAIAEALEEYERKVADVIADGQRNGQFAAGEPKILALIAIGTVEKAARWFDPKGSVGLDEFVETVLRMLLHGLDS